MRTKIHILGLSQVLGLIEYKDALLRYKLIDEDEYDAITKYINLILDPPEIFKQIYKEE